jgi:hypothetical protein
MLIASQGPNHPRKKEKYYKKELLFNGTQNR